MAATAKKKSRERLKRRTPSSKNNGARSANENVVEMPHRAHAGPSEGDSSVLDRPVKVTDRDFDEQVLDSDIPVLVDFWAEWCGPCKALAPALERLAADWAGKLKVVKYNTEQNRAVAQEMRIRSLPTMVLFHEGQVKDVQIGMVPFGRLERWVQRHIEPRPGFFKRLFGGSKGDDSDGEA
jgi:thioredoxin 1